MAAPHTTALEHTSIPVTVPVYTLHNTATNDIEQPLTTEAIVDGPSLLGPVVMLTSFHDYTLASFNPSVPGVRTQAPLSPDYQCTVEIAHNPTVTSLRDSSKVLPLTAYTVWQDREEELEAIEAGTPLPYGEPTSEEEWAYHAWTVVKKDTRHHRAEVVRAVQHGERFDLHIPHRDYVLKALNLYASLFSDPNQIHWDQLRLVMCNSLPVRHIVTCASLATAKQTLPRFLRENSVGEVHVCLPNIPMCYAVSHWIATQRLEGGERLRVFTLDAC